MSYTRGELFLLVKNKLNSNNDKLIKIIKTDVSKNLNYDYNLPQNLRQSIIKLLSQLRKKWKEANRTEKKIFSKFKKWLMVPVYFTKTKEHVESGRPSADFDSLSLRSKRRRTKSIRKEYCTESLTFATKMSLKASGKLEASKLIKEVASSSTDEVKKFKKISEQDKEHTLSGNEALSLLIENKLSKRQYQGLRSVSIDKNCNLYPPYNLVLESKKKCYPNDSQIIVTETYATITLQGLLNHTIERILMSESPIIESLPENNVDSLELVCKWGCDGTSGQSIYKQKFHEGGNLMSDENIFFISLVPLVLKCTKYDKIIWKNPRPCSTRFCRPIKIMFARETVSITKKEVSYIKLQENNLCSYECEMFGKKISVNFKLSLTMVDGKVCNSLTDTKSSMRCYLCKATSKIFNDIEKIISLPLDEEHLEFGLSPLHAWIRFFECCLHLSYKLDIKKWKVSENDEKIKVEERKLEVQKKFRDHLGLIVDQPKQNYGSSNDGNTARRFFENSELSSKLTGVDVNLIRRFHIILQVISSDFEVNIEKFRQYSLDTAKLYTKLYPWYFMPTTVHKILIHGDRIITSMLLPIGQMSEEAQESCNKYLKRFREDFSRKCDRVKNMEDVLHRLLIASDPVISNLRKLPAKKIKSLDSQAIELLELPSLKPHITDDDN